MRILHIHSGNLYGGVETVMRTLARCQTLVPGVEHVFALCFDGKIADELRSAGCEVHLLGEVRARQPLSVFQARRNLKKLCSSWKFNAALAHSAWSLAMLGPAAIRPLILYQHDVFQGRQWTEILARRTRPQLVIANSRFTAESTRRVFPDLAPVIIHPPIELAATRSDAAQRREMRAGFGASEKNVVILQAGRFEPWKGHKMLLRALADLRHNPDWFLWLAGEPQRPAERSFRDALHNFAVALGIRHRLAFIGQQADLPSVMRAADIYCQPNTRPEAFGLTFVEALHNGTPVVATALGGAKEILEPDWGILAEPEPRAVARALSGLLSDHALRQKLAARGPHRASELCDPRARILDIAEAVDSVRSISRTAA